MAVNYYEDLGRFGERLALIQEDGPELTYVQLEERTKKLSSFVKSRTLVFCFCTNTVGSVTGYLAFLNAKVVPVMVDAGINEELAQSLLERYQPDYLYVPDQLLERYGQHTQLYAADGYHLLQNADGAHWPLYEELALLLTTSGSTGSPKLVRQSYQNIQSNAEAIAEYLELDEMERPVTTLPMHYTYGLSIINSHLLVGASILLTAKAIVSRDFWAFMKENQATSFGGVPYTYEMLKRIRFFRMDLPHLRTMTQAGGKLQPQLHQEFAQYAEETGKRFIVMYGQTEATARMGWLPSERSLEKYGSMGVAIPGGTFHLIGADGAEITEPEVTGELIYEGPNVTLGYAQCGEDLDRGDERGGRLETGDMAKRDADGFYYIVGRKKRFLKIFGSRINLDEVDGLIRGQFGSQYEALDCAAAGQDDCMKVYLTLEECRTQVEEFLLERLQINPTALEVRVIDEIPKNEAGKTLYARLENM